MKKAVVVLLVVALLGSLATNYLLYHRYSSARPIVRVGNASITRREYEDQLDAHYGQAVLLDMVYADLIRNAATKAGVFPTASDVKAREDQIRKEPRIAKLSGVTPQMLDDANVETSAYARNDLRDRIAIAIAFERLRFRNVNPTDAELRAYYENNKLAFYAKQPTKTTMVYVSDDPGGGKAGEVEKLLEWGRTGETFAQKGYQVVGVNGVTLSAHLSPALKKQIDNAIATSTPYDDANSTDCVKEINLKKDESACLLIRLDSVAKEGIPPYEQIKPLVALTYKQQRGASSAAELTRLYQNDKVTVEVEKYKPFFSELQAAAERMAPRAKPSAAVADAMSAKR